MPIKSLHGGSFVPFVKYNAKTGRWSARLGDDREETRFENPRLVFDFANMKTGWIQFGETGAPLTQWDRVFDEEEPKPDAWAKARRGFKVHVLGLDGLDRTGRKLGVRELMSNSGALNGAIIAMYETWERERKSPNDLPFFKHTNTEIKGSGVKETAIPIFELVTMGDRSKFPQFDEAGIADEHIPTPDEDDGGMYPPADTAKGPAADTYMEDDIPF